MNSVPDWVLVFERLGPGMAILVFILAVAWQLLPSGKRLLGAWTAQTNAITRLIPSVVHALESIARSAESLSGSGADGAKVHRLRSDRDHADTRRDAPGAEVL